MCDLVATKLIFCVFSSGNIGFVAPTGPPGGAPAPGGFAPPPAGPTPAGGFAPGPSPYPAAPQPAGAPGYPQPGREVFIEDFEYIMHVKCSFN